MGAIEGTVYKSGNSAAVRLPKEIGLEIGTKVLIERIGNRVELRLKHDPGEEKRQLDRMIAALRELGSVTPVAPRDQPEAPERHGL